MGVVFIVFAFVLMVVLGPLFIIFGFLHLRRRSITKHELQEIRRDMAQMRSDIEDIKVQIADFIIKTHYQ